MTITDTTYDTDLQIPHGTYITGANDVNLYVEDSGGNGRPVVLIHGWPLSGQSWSEQVPALTDAGYRVINYDRRGFGRSDKPADGYDYDTFAADLDALLEKLDITDTTLIGFSMGGGEVARYLANYGSDRVRSIVFASAVTPYLANTDDNPQGPLDETSANDMETSLKNDRDDFFEDFVKNFYSANGDLKVSRQDVDTAIKLAQQSDQNAAIKSMEAFGTTDFRSDLATVLIPTLVIHGDADAIVPIDGSARLTHEAIPTSDLVIIEGGPHGVNVANSDQWNSAILTFLKK